MADKAPGKRGDDSVKAEDLSVVIKRKNRPPALPLRKISMKNNGESPPVLPADNRDRPATVSIDDRKKLLRRITIFNQDHRSFPSPVEGVLNVERWPMKPKLLRAPVLTNLRLHVIWLNSTLACPAPTVACSFVPSAFRSDRRQRSRSQTCTSWGSGAYL